MTRGDLFDLLDQVSLTLASAVEVSNMLVDVHEANEPVCLATMGIRTLVADARARIDGINRRSFLPPAPGVGDLQAQF